MILIMMMATTIHQYDDGDSGKYTIDDDSNDDEDDDGDSNSNSNDNENDNNTNNVDDNP